MTSPIETTKAEQPIHLCGASGFGYGLDDKCPACEHTRVGLSRGAEPEPRKYRDFEPCEHRGCLSHVTHPCDGCGRIAGQYPAPQPPRGEAETPTDKRENRIVIVEEDLFKKVKKILTPILRYPHERKQNNRVIREAISAAVLAYHSPKTRQPACDGCNPPAPKGVSLCHDCLEKANAD